MAERISRGVVVPLTAVLICGSLLLAHPSWCQDDNPRPPETAATEEAQAPSTDDPDEEPETEETEGETPDERKSRSGYDDLEQFGGPTSVAGRLKRADRIKRSRFGLGALDRALEPWWATKRRIHDRLGLSFVGILTGLYQGATASLGEDSAAGGNYQFLGTWNLVGEGRTAGTLGFQLEYRHRLGTEVSPETLFVELGSAASTAVDYSDFGLALTRLFWRQGLSQGRIVVLAGRVDPGDYVDTFPLNDPFTAFLNESLVGSPTAPAPEPGLGAGLGVFFRSKVYLAAGFSDANGSFTNAGLDTFFQEREYFKHLEIGWTPSFERRFLDNVHLVLWHIDERQEADLPSSWGLNFSYARTLDDRLVPFVRMGWSDGSVAPLEATISSGVGMEFSQGDQLGFGLSWGRPADGGLRDQYTAEIFYRLQVTAAFAVTPDVQVVFDPIFNKAEDSIFVFTLRAGLPL